jgi:tetratricopeptide (TPR) repeat protein
MIAFLLSSPSLAGEPQWVEVRSPHFSVVTDAGEKRGREVAMRFEQMRAVFGALLTKANVSLPIPLQIVAFRNSKEMRQVTPLFNGKPVQDAGFFQPGSDRCFIVLDMSVEDPWTVVFHEYAHQLLNGNIQGSIDPWFAEGFAEYFSSIEVDSKQARVGKIPHDEYVILQQTGMMRISDLFKVQPNSSTYNENGDHRTIFYAESAMLMHYIYDNQLLAKAASYFTLRDRHVPVEEAIQQAFGVSPQQFDKNLRSYAASGRYKYFPIANPPGIASDTYTTSPVTPVNVSAVIADIHLHTLDHQEQAVAEFQEILKSDPNNGAACRGLGYAYLQRQDFAHAAEYFDRAARLDSRDPRVHYYNALLMTQRNGFGSSADASEIARESEISITLDPTFADSYALLAFAQSTLGDSTRALATMQKAVTLNPQNQAYVFNLANLYYANHQPGQTISLLQSLQVTGNLGLATQVAQLLASARQLQEVPKNGFTNSGPPIAMRQAARIQEATIKDGSASQNADGNTAQSGIVTLHSRPAKYIHGTLTHSDCSAPPSALLTVVSQKNTWKLKVPDRHHLTLIGADEFSCSWTNQKVAVNYLEDTNGDTSVILLEIQ